MRRKLHESISLQYNWVRSREMRPNQVELFRRHGERLPWSPWSHRSLGRDPRDALQRQRIHESWLTTTFGCTRHDAVEVVPLAVLGDGSFDPVLPVEHVCVDAERALAPAINRVVAIARNADQDVLYVVGRIAMLVQLGVFREGGPPLVRDEETAPTVSRTGVLILAPEVQGREFV
jgi:hypothetical protein